MWADIKTNNGKDVKILNSEYIELESSNPGKVGGYIGALIGILVCLAAKPTGIFAAIMYICLIFAFGWMVEKIVAVAGITKKKEDAHRQKLMDAVFYSETSILQADEAKLKNELGSFYEAVKSDDGWLITHKKIQYKVTDLGDSSFNISVADAGKIETDVMEKVYGKIAYSLQKLCNDPAQAETEVFKANKKEPTAKDHAVLIAKLLIIILVIGTVVFQGGHSKTIHVGKYDFIASDNDENEGVCTFAVDEEGLWKYKYCTTDDYLRMNLIMTCYYYDERNSRDYYNEARLAVIMKSEDVDVSKTDLSDTSEEELRKADFVVFLLASDYPSYYVYDIGDGKIQFFRASGPNGIDPVDGTIWKWRQD